MPPSSRESAVDAFGMKAMSAALAVDEARAQLTDAVRVVEPIHEIDAGELVAAREVPGRRLDASPGHLPEGCGVQKSPLSQRWKFGADLPPVRFRRSSHRSEARTGFPIVASGEDPQIARLARSKAVSIIWPWRRRRFEISALAVSDPPSHEEPALGTKAMSSSHVHCLAGEKAA